MMKKIASISNQHSSVDPRQLQDPPYPPSEAKQISSGRISGITMIAIIIIIIIIMLISISFIMFESVGTGVSAFRDEYKNVYAAEKNKAYLAQYQKYFDQAEKEYHVNNQVSISIGDLKETATLEVLKISDIEYIVEESDDNGHGISSWLEVPGDGAYVVNLQEAEFIVDEQRSHVLVRIPTPELSNITIDYANVKKLLFENNLLNDSYKVGESLAQKQLAKGDLRIRKEYASNQNFYQNARKAAIRTIQCLVKQLNPHHPDLTVEVEFY